MLLKKTDTLNQLLNLFDLLPILKKNFNPKRFKKFIENPILSPSHQRILLPNFFKIIKNLAPGKSDGYFQLARDIIQEKKIISWQPNQWFSSLDLVNMAENINSLKQINDQQKNTILIFDVLIKEGRNSFKNSSHFDLGILEMLFVLLQSTYEGTEEEFRIFNKATIFDAKRDKKPLFVEKFLPKKNDTEIKYETRIAYTTSTTSCLNDYHALACFKFAA